MTDEPFSNREIQSMFHAADQRSDEFHNRLMERMGQQDNLLKEINKQTIKTNGRVTKLERYMLIVGTATTVLIVLRFPELKGLLGLL